MKNKQHFLFLSILSFVISGCASDFLGPAPNDPRFAPTYPDVSQPAPKKNGSIYQEGYARNLFGDRTARRIGDILTIRLEETTNAQKKADTVTNKAATTNLDTPTLFNNPVTQLTFNTSSTNNFNSRAESKQNNSLQGTISVTVANVLPNGNLVIQGESWLHINQGQEYVRLTGIVRTDDIDVNNTVSSQRVANARIGYSGTGQIANSNRAGILSRFFNAYSPF